MKLFLISCILTIFSTGRVQAESDTNNIGLDPCFLQSVEHLERRRTCLNENLNQIEILADLSTTILKYSGDNEAVRTLSDKYCPSFPAALQCTLIGVDEESECGSAIRDDQLRTYNLLTGLANYMCANRSAIVLQVLEHDGLSTMYENENFRACGKLMGKLCDGLNEAIDCYIDSVWEHPNRNLIGIANEVRSIYRRSLDCDGANELS